MHSPPITATSEMSTTSSFGRRPFGKPALSLPPARMLPTMPNRFCCAKGTGAMAVFRRSISEATTFLGWFTPLMPVRKVVTRSVRGKLVGAVLGRPSAISSSAGSVGCVT